MVCIAIRRHGDRAPKPLLGGGRQKTRPAQNSMFVLEHVLTFQGSAAWTIAARLETTPV